MLQGIYFAIAIIVVFVVVNRYGQQLMNFLPEPKKVPQFPPRFKVTPSAATVKEAEDQLIAEMRAKGLTKYSPTMQEAIAKTLRPTPKNIALLIALTVAVLLVFWPLLPFVFGFLVLRNSRTITIDPVAEAAKAEKLKQEQAAREEAALNGAFSG